MDEKCQHPSPVFEYITVVGVRKLESVFRCPDCGKRLVADGEILGEPLFTLGDDHEQEPLQDEPRK